MTPARYSGQLLLLALFLMVFGASAQPQWRPFRPGLVYSFATAATPGVTRPNVFLLRLDSAYTTPAGDSVWAFNRLLRPLDGSTPTFYTSARKSRNNLFGARLLWTPGTREFVLENVAEGTYQAALSLRLRPRAAVGSTWVASTAPALTATLTSRAWQPVTSAVGSPSDSVAIITLSSGAVLRLSRRYGLLAAPRWLVVGSSAAPQWQAYDLPAPLAGTLLSPLALFNFQPGDRLGYEIAEIFIVGLTCTISFNLRVIQTRQVTGDSLRYTYQEQTRVVTYNCYGTSGTVDGPVRTGRLAFGLRTGRSPQYVALALLSGEYRTVPNRGITIVVGRGLSLANGTDCFSGSNIGYQQLYPSSGGIYSFPTDFGWTQTFAPQSGLGDVLTNDGSIGTTLAYAQRSTPGGTVTCGSPINFVNLLPTRATQAAAIATLHPNPGAEAATLTLVRPARAGASLRLTDALGRVVWNAPVPVGQSTVAVPLAEQPAGLYLLHLTGPDGTSATWKLTHE